MQQPLHLMYLPLYSMTHSKKMKCREKNKVNHNNADHFILEHLELQLTIVSEVILPKYCYKGV